MNHMAANARMSQREQARELNLSQPQVCRYRQQGMPDNLPGAQAWLAQHVHVRVKSGLDREGQMRRRRPVKQQRVASDEDRPMDLGDAFLNCAIYAQRDLARYAPIVLHLWRLLALEDEQAARIVAHEEMPEA